MGGWVECMRMTSAESALANRDASSSTEVVAGEKSMGTRSVFMILYPKGMGYLWLCTYWYWLSII